MVSVNSYRRNGYTRYNQFGTPVHVSPHKVNSHNRSVKHERGDYDIEKRRQYPSQSNPYADSLIKARKPGKRMSSKKNIYYERRYNRSDANTYL